MTSRSCSASDPEMSAMVLVYEEVSPGVGFYAEEPAPTTPEEPMWFREYDQYWFDYLCEEVPNAVSYPQDTASD